MSDMTPLLEYYQGKTKELVKCEELFKQLIAQVKKYRKDLLENKNLSAQNPLTKDNPICKKIEEEFKKLFKVREFNIYWTSGTVNGYTIKPCFLMIPHNQKLWKQGKDINMNIHVWLYEELITMANLNERELIGVILHEAGHNFYYCPIMMGFQVFACVITMGTAIIQMLIGKLIHIGSAMINDVIKKHVPVLYNIMTCLSDFMYDIKRITGTADFIGKLGKLLTGQAYLLVPDPLTATFKLTKYGDESGADSMAARYGYGPDNISALRKMSMMEESMYGKLRSETGVFGSVYFDMIEMASELIHMIVLEPHPSHNQRASNTLKKLKRDLASNDFPPAAKKDLEREIKRMEEMYKIVNTNNSSSNVQIKKDWYNVINAVTDGNSDFREIFSFYFDSYSF